MSIIDMINEEIYDFDIIDTYYCSKEEMIRLQSLMALENENRFNHQAIVQWLYYDEKDYHNWVYNFDKKKEVDAI